MESTDFVTIRSFDHRMRADMLLLLLQQQGIPARLVDEHIVAMEWVLANAIGGIKVQVPLEHQPMAHRVAEEMQARGKSGDDDSSPDLEDRCLACHAAMPEDQNVCADCGWSYDT